MIRSFTLFVLLCCAVPLAFGTEYANGTIGVPGNEPTGVDTVGPDAWGYTAIRSNEPGGPVFNWVDITTTGTQVAGLGDDNYVGPFPMQFQFPYYWYTVDRFYVGSNGYINFSAPGNFAPPFAALPNGAAPNDMLAICVGDLCVSGQTGAGGQVYYWTNGSDSAIVSFINITEWEQTINPNTRHTFQVILRKADSSITYQYGRQEGRYNSTNNTRLCIGMENATGQIGLNYAYSTAPPHALLPDSGMAIRLKRTVNTGLQITDAGIVGGLNTANIGKVVKVSVADTVKCIAKNFGTTTLSNVRITYQITRALETYRDTVFLASMPPASQTTVTFPRLFTPTVTGSYSARFDAFVSGDQGPGNNNKIAEIYSAPFAVGQSTRLQFESGTSSGSINWIGGGGMGVMFDSPLYPVRIETVWVQVSSITANPMLVQIIDGSSGSPGAVLAERSITAVVGLNAINFTSDSVRIPSGRWFVGGRGQMAFTYETTAPISYRSWEYTGGWAPYRSGDLQDAIIRCSVRPETPPPAGFFDDFEAYTVGQRLACQNPTVWTTWSNLPCNTTEDALISSAQAFSGTKSVVIAQNNDLVKPLGGDTTGVHRITFKMYIPTGKAGYFNTLGTFAGASSNWAMQVYFDVGGGGRIFAGSSTAGTFAYTYNTWHTAEVLVNLNADTGKFYMNGNLIRSWRWTAGTFGSGGPRRLDANNFFGATANDEMYVDDYRAEDVTVGVDEDELLIPETYTLDQNYPNPFNPTTTIGYSLPAAASVKLSIYNMLGQRVADLVGETQTAGYYRVDWDGRNLVGSQVSSGVYFYRLEARPTDGSSPVTNIKKMLLLK